MSDLPYSREVYPNAPLKLVACELRFQLAPGADLGAASRPVYDDVEGEYPLQGPAPSQGFRFAVGPGAAPPEVVQNGFRYLSRDRTHSLAVSPEALIIETSAYTKFDEFSSAICRAVEVLGRHLRVASVERIGLRYIDEIEVSDLPDGTLDGYFNPLSLAGGVAVEHVGEPVEFLETTRYTLDGDSHAVMRAGMVSNSIVASNGPLRIPTPSTGPIFVIDVDCFWESSTPLEFNSESVGGILDALHLPVRALFEHTITDKLRDEVLRKEPSNT